MSAKQQPTGVIAAECYFSNAGTVAITQLAFQLAVRAGMQLQLDPASGNILPPKSVNSVMQTLRIANPAKVGQDALRIC